MKTPSFLVAGSLVGLMLAVPALAEDHQVQMLNKDSEGRAMQFEPAFLKIAPGDTVTFIAATKGHNSESILTLTIQEIDSPSRGRGRSTKKSPSPSIPKDFLPTNASPISPWGWWG